ncbi:MAG: hydrogenase expression/formation C-terminal domain-containing protein [Gammaproteobacteria bacterium]|jgi:hydrogenase-1 operon protein HyaF
MSDTGVVEFSVEAGEALTHNVTPLLHEIRHGLARLLENGAATTIDLRGIPMAPGEEERIIRELGTGEVQARLSALGPSEIMETRFPGVWLVTHYNGENEVIGKFIEVCDMPQILKAQAEDIREGLAQLTAQLA